MKRPQSQEKVRRIAPWSNAALEKAGSNSRVILGCGNFGGIGSSPEFFDRARPRTLRSGSWTPRGSSGSRRSIPPTRTAAAAARPSSASGLQQRAPTSGTHRHCDEDVQPDGRGRGSRARPRADPRQLEASLRRLGIDRVALYLAHDFDPDTPQEESARARRAGARRQGRRCRRVELHRRAARRGARDLRARGPHPLRVGPEWVLAARAGRPRTVFPVCESITSDTRRSVRSQAAGLRGSTPRRARARRLAYDPSARAVRGVPLGPFFDALEMLEREAAERGVSMASLALAWLLALPEITGTLSGQTGHDTWRRPSKPSETSPHRWGRPDGGFCMSVLILSSTDVRALLNMESCIRSMEEVLARLAADELHNPLRFVMRPPATR